MAIQHARGLGALVDAVAAKVVAADGNGLTRRHVQADGACPVRSLLCWPQLLRTHMHPRLVTF